MADDGSLLPPCAVDGCTNGAATRGWCRMHYNRWLRHGDTSVCLRATTPDESFEKFVRRTSTNGCWIWAGARNDRGYAQMSINGRTTYVHVWAWETSHGPVPPGMQLDHFVCDNGAAGCVNPSHVRPTTARENNLRSGSPAAINARKTHCPKGHPYPPGRRVCLACGRDHYHDRKASAPPCSVDGCGRPVRAKGLCGGCYVKSRREDPANATHN